ncbi:fimbrillin family protein [Sphingobacterium faecium]|uniref:fimbrillin family protein n=1 Tax=Sphingobacterium faecium TaxID=34087 RepID=UPI0032078873
MMLILLFASCSKTKNELILQDDTANLLIKIEGVSEALTTSSLKASAGSSMGMLSTANILRSETFTKDDLVLEAFCSQDINSRGFDQEQPRKLRAATTSPMENNIKFRIMLYTSDNMLVSSLEGKVGESLKIPAVPNKTYKWYAYSFNTTDAISAPNNTNPVITTPTNTPLLYAQGTIVAGNETTALPITFKHQLAQIKVEVKESTGIRAILGITGSFSRNDYVQTSTFDLRTGENTGSLFSANVTDLNFLTEIAADTVKKVAKYYTANTDLVAYSVKINSLEIQYTSTTTRSLTPSNLPNNGEVSFSFSSTTGSKKGYVLKGTLQMSFILPTMKILPFSNSLDSDGYRFGTNTAAGAFLRTSTNFGPTSQYVKVRSLNIVAPTSANEATTGTTGWNRFKALMSNPADYPDILVVANWYNYLNDEGWDLLKTYIDRGGNVLYTHDEPDPVYEKYAQRGIGNILGQTVSMSDVTEFYGIYKFTDTQDGANDTEILNGPFGDVRPYNWGQDRVGTSYVNGYTGDNVIVYSNHSQIHKPLTIPGMCFFRHKTKGFFFVGDGGFYNNPNGNSSQNSFTDFPFRINLTTKFPILANFGDAPQLGSPTYGTVSGTGKFTIANSMVFGNIMAHMLNRAHYYGINRD